MSDLALTRLPEMGSRTGAAGFAWAEVPLAPATAAPGRRVTCLHVFEGGLFVGLEAMGAASGGGVLRVDLRDGRVEEVVSLPPPDPADLEAWQAEAAWLPGAGRLDPGRAPSSAVTGLASFQGPGDDRLRLYATTASLRGGDLLRWDGERGHARVWSQPRRGPGLAGLGCPVAWDGRLALVSWGPSRADDPDLASTGAVLASTDPGRGPWEPLSRPGLGDSLNLEVTAMAVAFGRLHAGTRNDVRGFQVWSASQRPSEEGLVPWAQVLGGGAHRFAMSPSVAALTAFRGNLFVASRAWPGDLPGLGDPAAEVIRVGLDGEWEVVAGELRVTPDGLKVPLAFDGPGLGDPAALGALVASGPSHVVAASSSGRLIWSRDGEFWDTEGALAEMLTDPSAQASAGPAVSALAVAGGELYAAAGARLLRATLPA